MSGQKMCFEGPISGRVDTIVLHVRSRMWEMMRGMVGKLQTKDE